VRAARLHAVGGLRVSEEPVPEAGQLGGTASVVGCGEAALRVGLKVIIEPQQ
jgi:hypothetical protein